MKITILDDYFSRASAYADWNRADFATIEFVDRHIADEDALVDLLIHSDAIGVMRERTPITRSLINRLPNLKLIVTSGKQNASIDLAAAQARGIRVCGTQSPGHSTAELAFLLIMLLCRRAIPLINGLRQKGVWQPDMGQDLRGKTLGIMGLGRIGSQVAAMGKVFGMRVIAWSQNLTPADCDQQGVDYVSKAELFRSANFVSIHMRLSERTSNIVGKDELGALGAHGYLINTSRAGLVDQVALLNALNSNALGGLGTDVFTVEPATQRDPLVAHPRVLATPHIGYCTKETFEVFYSEMLECFEAFHAGRPIRVLT